MLVAKAARASQQESSGESWDRCFVRHPSLWGGDSEGAAARQVRSMSTVMRTGCASGEGAAAGPYKSRRDSSDMLIGSGKRLGRACRVSGVASAIPRLPARLVARETDSCESALSHGGLL
jgi:hypothetical protein